MRHLSSDTVTEILWVSRMNGRICITYSNADLIYRTSQRNKIYNFKKNKKWKPIRQRTQLDEIRNRRCVIARPTISGFLLSFVGTTVCCMTRITASSWLTIFTVWTTSRARLIIACICIHISHQQIDDTAKSTHLKLHSVLLLILLLLLLLLYKIYIAHKFKQARVRGTGVAQSGSQRVERE